LVVWLTAITSGTDRPISPPVRPANTTTKFCSISTATSVVRPKYGPRTRSAGNASTTPPITAAAAPRAMHSQIEMPGEYLASRMPAVYAPSPIRNVGPKFTSPAKPKSRSQAIANTAV